VIRQQGIPRHDMRPCQAMHQHPTRQVQYSKTTGHLDRRTSVACQFLRGKKTGGILPPALRRSFPIELLTSALPRRVLLCRWWLPVRPEPSLLSIGPRRPLARRNWLTLSSCPNLRHRPGKSVPASGAGVIWMVQGVASARTSKWIGMSAAPVYVHEGQKGTDGAALALAAGAQGRRNEPAMPEPGSEMTLAGIRFRNHVGRNRVPKRR